MNIDITKKYTTRSGLPVRIYAVDGGGLFTVHGAVNIDRLPQQQEDRFAQVCWTKVGSRCNSSVTDEWDLLPVKTWRAWRKWECPKRLITRHKRTFQISAINTGSHSDMQLAELFRDYEWLHEDGTVTPCGVEE